MDRAEMLRSFGSSLRKTLQGMKPLGAVHAVEGGNSRMDMTWVTGRIALGLAQAHAIEVLWNAIDDDFQPKPPVVFQRGVEFAIEALDQPGTKLYIHCAAGVHRAPMMALALLCALGWK